MYVTIRFKCFGVNFVSGAELFIDIDPVRLKFYVPHVSLSLCFSVTYSILIQNQKNTDKLKLV